MLNKITQGDAIEEMRKLADKSVDMILCDLPYGTTSCKWDTIIPFEPLWAEYERIIKDNGAIVLTSAQPFTTALISSNMQDFKYCWYWYKNMASGFQLAKKQPMRAIEEVVVFYKSQPTYNPQQTESKIKDRKRVVGAKNGSSKKRDNFENPHKYGTKEQSITFKESVSPRNVLEIPVVPRARGTLHPTQKPVALFEYLIKHIQTKATVILDNCIGSGTTAVAAINTGRQFIGIEREAEYCEIARQRIADALQTEVDGN
jgi:site-specific DNA-methyltransferase (adenine-specific)